MSWKYIGEWRYSSSILDLGGRWMWVVSFTPQPLYHSGKPSVSIRQEAGWAPERVWTLGKRQEFLAPNGNRTSAVARSTGLCVNTKNSYAVLRHLRQQGGHPGWLCLDYSPECKLQTDRATAVYYWLHANKLPMGLIVTKLRAGRPKSRSSILGSGKRYFSTPQRSRSAMGPAQPNISSEYRKLFLRG
jgi:hypothetical protein